MTCSFGSMQTRSGFFSSRLYVLTNDEKLPRLQHQEKLKKFVFYQGHERKSLGMTTYSPFIGRLLAFCNVAFKSFDEHGNTLYINKKSFCSLVGRLSSSFVRKTIDFDQIEKDYVYKNAITQKRFEDVKTIFLAHAKELSGKNIQDISTTIIQKHLQKIFVDHFFGQ